MRKTSIRRLAIAGVCAATAAAMTVVATEPAMAATDGTNVVINEVYGGGGNSGATYTNDFIELYNPTDSSISVEGWSVQYASYRGTSWTNKTALSGTISAHDYYLVQEAAGSGGSEALPDPDATGSINMSGTHGKVALVTDNTDLTCGDDCIGADGVIDFVGFGSDATDYEGSGPAPTISNTTSDARTNGVDTDDNAADFTKGVPTPQNSSAGGGTSTVTVANPGTWRGTVGKSLKLTLHASGGSGSYTWEASGLPGGLSISKADGVISGTPTTAGDSSVTATATDANDSSASGSATFTISIAGPAQQVSIAEINGSDSTSSYDGQDVITTGVVTADYATGGFNGFYLQTGGSGTAPDHPDQTPGESDAVFVYGSRSAGDVQIGESVKVKGTVTTYQGMTEIEYPTVTKLDDSLPAVVPDQIAWKDLNTNAEKQAHAGELMAPQGDFTVTDNYNINYYGSMTLAAGKTPLTQPTDVGTPGSQAAKNAVADNAKRTITLDDGSSWNYAVFGDHTSDPLPWVTTSTPVRIGSAVTFNEPVILDYRNDLWNFQPTQQVTDNGSDVATFSNDRAANEHPASVGGDVSMATFNVENYFPMTGEKYEAKGLGTCSWYEDREGNKITVNRCSGSGGQGPRGAANDVNLARQQAKIVNGINRLGASIVSLEEIGNSVKFGEPRDTALATLVDALNKAAGSKKWAYIHSADELPPTDQQDVIRIALIYQPAKVTPVGKSHVLTGDSGEGQPFSIAREPVAQAFKKAGAGDENSFLVVGNHLKSKGADQDGLFDDCTHGGDAENTDPAKNQGAFNCTRVHEARDLATFASQQADNAGTDKIFLLGDFNAYTHEDPLQALYSDGYTDLGSEFDPSESTYSYNGLEGSLDHVLANPAALKMVTGADVWQINAQEAIPFAYSRYNYNIRDLFNGSQPFAASDHDPVVVGLNLPGAAEWNAKTVYTSGDEVSYDGSTWRALWWTQNQRPGASAYGPWEQIVTTSDGTAVWTPSRIFTSGDVAVYHGTTYRAKWWTRDQEPGASQYGPWEAIG